MENVRWYMHRHDNQQEQDGNLTLAEEGDEMIQEKKAQQRTELHKESVLCHVEKETRRDGQGI